MKKFDSYEVEVNKYYLDIKFEKDKESSFKTLEELYNYVKSFQNDYIKKGNIVDTSFLLISDNIYRCEDIFFD